MYSYISSYQRPSGACRSIRYSSDRFGYPSSYNHGSRRYARRRPDHFGRYRQEHRADRQYLPSARSDWTQNRHSRSYSEHPRHPNDTYETEYSDLYGSHNVPNPYDPLYSSPWEHTPRKLRISDHVDRQIAANLINPYSGSPVWPTTGRPDIDLQISRCIDAGYSSCYVFPGNHFSIIHSYDCPYKTTSTPPEHSSSQLASLDLRRNRGVSNLTELGLTSSALSYTPPKGHQAPNNNMAPNLHVLSGQTFTPINSIQPNGTSGQDHVDRIVEQINKLGISEDDGSAGGINRNLEEQAVGGQSADLEKLDLGQRTMNDWVETDADESGSANADLGVGHWQKGQPHASVVEGNGDNDSVAGDLDRGSNFCRHPKQSGGWKSASSHNPALENLDENEFAENLPGTLTPTSSEGSNWDYPL